MATNDDGRLPVTNATLLSMGSTGTRLHPACARWSPSVSSKLPSTGYRPVGNAQPTDEWRRIQDSGRRRHHCAHGRKAKKSPVRAGSAHYVLNSANYGSLTINKAVAIISGEAISGVLATSAHTSLMP